MPVLQLHKSPLNQPQHLSCVLPTWCCVANPHSLIHFNSLTFELYNISLCVRVCTFWPCCTTCTRWIRRCCVAVEYFGVELSRWPHFITVSRRIHTPLTSANRWKSPKSSEERFCHCKAGHSFVQGKRFTRQTPLLHHSKVQSGQLFLLQVKDIFYWQFFIELRYPECKI